MTAADAREPLGTPRPPRLPEGFRIGGWEIGAVIGSGGWGTVYAARTVADGTPVAVKVLPTGALAPGQRTALGELVDREVRFSSGADHPHLIRTRAVCTVDAPAHLPALDGAVALVMDLAEGSLKDVLDTAATGSPLANAHRVLRGTAAGLAHMHGAKWVHGDLKPANVLLGANGQVWLADFGLAAELDGSHAHLPPLGTLDHLPPEWWSQRTGPRGTLVRPTADIWAFGVLAHQVLTGGLHPFPGATARARSLAAQAYARGTAPLRLDAGLDEGWRRLIADCLAPRPRLTPPPHGRNPHHADQGADGRDTPPPPEGTPDPGHRRRAGRTGRRGNHRDGPSLRRRPRRRPSPHTRPRRHHHADHGARRHSPGLRRTRGAPPRHRPSRPALHRRGDHPRLPRRTAEGRKRLRRERLPSEHRRVRHRHVDPVGVPRLGRRRRR
ncbi:serine/threonine protein kinase [Streptomyces somaliensis]|uniref:serine/threonine-protein kinase n=1 Tax=Streptomyces somaliensis TaxID=78355 RepID=UPI0034E974C2|nr:serine/threonine protein kinase [Streptomyces somaliensis]MCP9972998.1 serine/threonine protein kinase [Streptomyces somaliensis]